jgi:hypothetical protein
MCSMQWFCVKVEDGLLLLPFEDPVVWLLGLL